MRSAVLREALGVARYLCEDWSGATSELLAYRRLSGRHDNDHVLADCARALGRHDKVLEYVEGMAAARVDAERLAEGFIVLAGDRADRGDLRGAMAALARAGLEPEIIRPWQVRVWWVAADLSERLGDAEAARDYLEAILALDPEFPGAQERLDALAG